MRKHLSVLMLFVRSNFIPSIILCLLMAAVQIGYYFFAVAGEQMLVETMIDEAPFAFIFMLFSALMVKWLCQACTGRRAKPIYTLSRLNVSPAMVFVWQSVCNLLLWLVFFACEIFVMLFICRHYVSCVGEDYATSQSLMLAFYREKFLHSLLPMEETSRWIRNGVYILGMALICANSSRKLRLGKLAIILPAAALAFMSLSFPAQMIEDGLDIFCSAAIIIVCVIIVISVFTGGEEVEDEIDEETP